MSLLFTIVFSLFISFSCEWIGDHNSVRNERDEYTNSFTKQLGRVELATTCTPIIFHRKDVAWQCTRERRC